MNLYISSLIVPRTARNKRIYAGDSFNSSSRTASSITGTGVIPKDIIPFAASSLPTISDYQTTYAAIHGNQPTVILMIITAVGRYQSQQQPQFTLLTNTGSPDDLIDTIFFDLGNPETGYIILQ